MLNNPLISIAMCTYNGENYIQEQLDSILKQTYTNYEIMINDDCSTDGTIEIIKNYQKKYSQIKLYQNEKNLGFLKNFEQAISLCKGDYIALADQDDIWKEHKLEIFLENIKDNALIYSDAIIIDKDSHEIGRELIRPKSNLCKGSCNKAFLLNNFISGNTMMFKQELVKYILPIPNKMSYHDIWIGFVASTYGTITYTDEAMTYYRKYSGQVTENKNQIPKDFFAKLKYKEQLKIKDAQTAIEHLESFQSLKILQDTETIEIINELLEHYKNYKNIYFNFKLYKLLLKHTQEIFASIRSSKRQRRAFRTAVGLKLKKISAFTL